MGRTSSVSASLSPFTVWILLFMLAPALIACGGGSGSNGIMTGGSGNTSGSVPPASGEYLWVTWSQLNVATINTTNGELGPLNQTGILADTSPNPVVFPSADTLFLVGGPDSSTLQRYTLSGPGIQLAWDTGWSLDLGSRDFVQHPSGKVMYAFDGAIQLVYIEQGGQYLNLGPAVGNNATSFTIGAMDPAGKFLFAYDGYGSGIYVYQINQTDYTLTPVAGSPFALPTYSSHNGSRGIVIGGSGNSLFLFLGLNLENSSSGTSSSGIAEFAINDSTGALTSVSDSPIQTNDEFPPGLCVDPSGKFLYATEDTFTSGSAGGIYGFLINPLNGGLSPLAGSPFGSSGSVSYSSPVLDPSGRFLYAAGYTNSTAEGGVYGFSFNSATGALSPVTGSPFFNSKQGAISSIGTTNIP